MLALIVAYTRNRVIGRHGVIPWNIPGERERFKRLTTGNVVVMGRRTYEEIGKPLPNRTTIVVSRTKHAHGEHCMTARSLTEALRMAGEKDVYICGGAELYREAIPLVEKMYITVIDCEMEGDTYFPAFDENEFHVTLDGSFDGKLPYRYYTYTRKESETRRGTT